MGICGNTLPLPAELTNSKRLLKDSLALAELAQGKVLPHVPTGYHWLPLGS